MRSMVWPIALIAPTDSSVASCMPAIWLLIFLDRLGGLSGEALDLLGNHSKAGAGIARPRRLEASADCERRPWCTPSR
jgi:hypothetical protein